MAKKNFQKSAKNGKEKKAYENAVEMVEKGEMLGSSFIGIMAMSATNWKGIGIATYALAKAWAALKSIAEDADVEVDSLFEGTTSNFLQVYREDVGSLNEIEEN